MADKALSIEQAIVRKNVPPRDSQRLHMHPDERLVLGAFVAGAYGFLNGIIKGARVSSLRFLAENAHRLPRTKGTWYFFHKRKNYVVLRDGLNRGAINAAKFTAVAGAFLAIEAYFDDLRGKVDALSTIGASTLVGAGVAAFKRLGGRQLVRSTAGFVVFGALVGGAEDALRYAREQAAKETEEQKNKLEQ